MKRILFTALILLVTATMAIAGPLDILRAELDADPLNRGYAGMNNSQIANSLNTANRTLWKTITSADVFEAIDIAEYAALTDPQKDVVRLVLGLGGRIDTAPGSKLRTAILGTFGNPSNTLTALVAQAARTVSRAEELGIPVVGEGTVAQAKALP